MNGRVVIVTGAGSGLGREHALFLGLQGAHVVVNDMTASPADSVAAEITSAGGTALAVAADVSEWDGARDLIRGAVDKFGQLDALVNNAGIVRRGELYDMSQADFDAVVRVHLRGHFAPLRWAARYWRDEAVEGRRRRAAVVNTTSLHGLGTLHSPVSYGASKAAIAQLTINASVQLRDSGVRVNAIAPAARTPATEAVLPAPASTDAFDHFHAANVSPLVGYLCTADGHETGRVYLVHGGFVGLLQPWQMAGWIDKPGRWTVDELRREMPELDHDVTLLPTRAQGFRPDSPHADQRGAGVTHPTTQEP